MSVHPPFDDDLTTPAASLARRAPQEWNEFIAAFRKYAERRRDEMMRAPNEELQRSQGRAQACSVLVPLLEDAVKAADRVNSRQR